METSHPSNVEDHDIPAGITSISEESYSLPPRTPTSMSYFLCRIHIGTLVREVVDSLPPTFFISPTAEYGDEVYDNIIAFDRRYTEHVKSLPYFFQLTIPQDHIDDYQLLIQEKPYLEWQRLLINFVIHTHWARLHRPFLIRGATQPKYAYSRMQCLHCAQTVLDIRSRTISDHNMGAFMYIMQHFLMAAIILAVDICSNPNDVRVSERKQEVLQACRTLDRELNSKTISSNGAEAENASTGQFVIKSLRKVVQKLREALMKKTSEPPGHDLSVEVPAVSADEKRQISQEFPARDILPTLESGSDQPRQSSPHTYDQDGEQQTSAVSPLNPGGTQVPNEPMMDDLWDEFFNVGSNFNDADWDEFLLDVGGQMGGMD